MHRWDGLCVRTAISFCSPAEPLKVIEGHLYNSGTLDTDNVKALLPLCTHSVARTDACLRVMVNAKTPRVYRLIKFGMGSHHLPTEEEWHLC